MPYAELFAQSTSVSGNVTTSVVIAAGPAHTPLIVIDSIIATGQSDAGGAITLEHTITGGSGTIVFARQQLPAVSQPVYFHLDFAGGWPIWIVSANDTTPGGATTIAIRSAANLSNSCMTVIYHYEKASARN